MSPTFKVFYWLRIIIGCVFILFAFIGIGFGIFAMIDPVGSRQFDDGNPDGIAPPFTDGLYSTIVWAAVFTFGLWLVVGRLRKRPIL